jgi:hypothetical protein
MDGTSEPGSGAHEPPAQRAWNVDTVIVGTGETLLGPHPAGVWSVPGYNR